MDELIEAIDYELLQNGCCKIFIYLDADSEIRYKFVDPEDE